MGNLLDAYNRLSTSSFEKVAEEAIVNERMEFLEKVANFAEASLAETFGNDYTAEDVEKLAYMLIADAQIAEEESAAAEEHEKVAAELFEAGMIMAEGIKAGLNS